MSKTNTAAVVEMRKQFAAYRAQALATGMSAETFKYRAASLAAELADGEEVTAAQHVSAACEVAGLAQQAVGAKSPAAYVAQHIDGITASLRDRAHEPRVRAALVEHVTTQGIVGTVSGAVWAAYMAPAVIKACR